MRKVKLYGELAKKFGREFMLEVESVAELCVPFLLIFQALRKS